MNQEKFKGLMDKANMSRVDLAVLCGCHIKTTYWEFVPGYAVTIVMQLIELQQSKEAKTALAGWLN